jgi:hypothetical protein
MEGTRKQPMFLMERRTLLLLLVLLYINRNTSSGEIRILLLPLQIKLSFITKFIYHFIVSGDI